MKESLFTTEQNVIDWIADRYQEELERHGSGIMAKRALGERLARLGYFATGSEYEVRQVLKPPTNPNNPRRRSLR